MKKNIVAVVALASLACVFSRSAQGQNQDCPRYFQIVNTAKNGCALVWGWNSLSGGVNLPANAACCNPAGIPFGMECRALQPQCGPPPAAASETCIACNRAKTAQATQPIDLATGNTYISQSDISVPGLGGGLSLSRIWNSMLPAIQSSFPFMFGAKWRSTYEERLVFVNGDSYIKYLRSDGSVWSFGVATSGTPNTYKAAAPADDTTTTLIDGPSTWTLTSKSGEKRTFDSTSGALLSIIDRNGNATQLSYDASSRLATVTDPASRHIYFNYPDSSSPLVSSVTSDVGLTLAYLYDSQGRLTQVTKPDMTNLSFLYDTQSMITTVKDSDGKVLESHTYDILGRGLSGSRANGVESVTVSYP